MRSKLALLRRVESLRRRQRDLAASVLAEAERAELRARDDREAAVEAQRAHLDAIAEAARHGPAGLELWLAERANYAHALDARAQALGAAHEKTGQARRVVAERTVVLERTRTIATRTHEAIEQLEAHEEQKDSDERAAWPRRRWS
jgi:hypothetical protein